MAARVPEGNHLRPATEPFSSDNFQRSMAPKGANSKANHCRRRCKCWDLLSTTAKTIQRLVSSITMKSTDRCVCTAKSFSVSLKEFVQARKVDTCSYVLCELHITWNVALPGELLLRGQSSAIGLVLETSLPQAKPTLTLG